MRKLSNYFRSDACIQTRITRASVFAGGVFLAAVLTRVVYPGIADSLLWALLDVLGVLFAGFAFLTGSTTIYQHHWIVFLIPGYVCFTLLLLALDPFQGTRQKPHRSYARVVTCGFLFGGAYLVAGEVVGVTSYLSTGVSQFVDSLYDGPHAQKIGTILVSFLVLRLVVAIVVGELIAIAIRFGKVAWTALLVGALVPTLVELALYRMLIPDWFSMGLDGLRIAMSYLVAPFIGGLVAGALGVRFRDSGRL